MAGDKTLKGTFFTAKMTVRHLSQKSNEGRNITKDVWLTMASSTKNYNLVSSISLKIISLCPGSLFIFLSLMCHCSWSLPQLHTLISFCSLHAAYHFNLKNTTYISIYSKHIPHLGRGRSWAQPSCKGSSFRLLQSLHLCWCCPNPPVNPLLHFPLPHE